jgi:dTMP kinase
LVHRHLETGGIVLCDRYADSSLAYQGYGHQLDLDMLRAITRFATSNLVPALTLYLDLPVKVGLERKTGGAGDAWNRMEQKEVAYHERVRAGYLEMAEQEPARWTVVDAKGSVDQVQVAIRDSLVSRF